MTEEKEEAKMQLENGHVDVVKDQKEKRGEMGRIMEEGRREDKQGKNGRRKKKREGEAKEGNEEKRRGDGVVCCCWTGEMLEVTLKSGAA